MDNYFKPDYSYCGNELYSHTHQLQWIRMRYFNCEYLFMDCGSRSHHQHFGCYNDMQRRHGLTDIFKLQRHGHMQLSVAVVSRSKHLDERGHHSELYHRGADFHDILPLPQILQRFGL